MSLKSYSTTIYLHSNKIQQRKFFFRCFLLSNNFQKQSNGKISKVTDGLGDVYNFTWTDTLIQIKKEIAADDSTTETLLAEITLASEQVTQVKYALSGDTVHFAYDENGQLVSVLDSASHQKALFE